MRLVLSFLHFWYDFIVGDDIFVAVGIVVLLVAGRLAVLAQIAIWPVFPLVVIGILGNSVWRGGR